MRLWFPVLAGLAALLVATPAVPQTFQTIPAPSGVAPPNHIWQPAPTVRGSIPWKTLMRTREVEKKVDGVWMIVPQFAKDVLPLNGRTVKVNGYMLPLQTREGQDLFVLMAYPPDCPFCMTAGSQAWMEVRARDPIAYKRGDMLLEGRLELAKPNMEGVFYRLHDARVVQ
jgi:hypothetical protein